MELSQRSERLDWPPVLHQRERQIRTEHEHQRENDSAKQSTGYHHQHPAEESSFLAAESEGRARYTSRSSPYSQEPLQGYIYHKPDNETVQYQQLDHNSNFAGENSPVALQRNDYHEAKTAPSHRESPAVGIARYHHSPSSANSNSRSPIPSQEASPNPPREGALLSTQQQVYSTSGQQHLTLEVLAQEQLLKQEEVEHFFSGLHGTLTPQQQHYHHLAGQNQHQHQHPLQPQSAPSEGTVVSRAAASTLQQQPSATSHTPQDPPAAPSDCSSTTVSSSTPHQHYPLVSPRDNIACTSSSSPSTSGLKDPRDLVATTLVHHTATGLSSYTSPSHHNHLHHSATMFQGANSTMTAMHPGTGPSAYTDPTGQSFLHPGTGASPVYVPTTRTMLPTYMSGNGASSPQTSVSPNSAAVWTAMQDTAQGSYSTSATHHGATVGPRLSFPPTPSPPGMGSPGSRVGETGVPAGFGSSLAARPAGLSPYSAYMGTADLSAWNGLYNNQVCPPFGY